MVKKIIIISLLMAASNIITAQEAPRNANLIQIKTSDNIDESFRKIGRMLGTEGYKLETVDRDFYMIATEVMEKDFGGFLGAARARLEIKFNIQFDEIPEGTTINIRGTFRDITKTSFSVSGDFQRIENRGARNSILRDSWNFMNEIALKYDNGELSYIIEDTN